MLPYLQHDDACVARIADNYLTEDGCPGRLAELRSADTPMVLVTHWQSLFSNGRQTGLRILNEICRRVDACWADKVQWTNCSDLARRGRRR